MIEVALFLIAAVKESCLRRRLRVCKIKNSKVRAKNACRVLAIGLRDRIARVYKGRREAWGKTLFLDAHKELYQISCILNPVSSIMYHVSCIMYYVSCSMYHVSCIMYHVCILYHVSCIYPIFRINGFINWFIDLINKSLDWLFLKWLNDWLLLMWRSRMEDPRRGQWQGRITSSLSR